jgi:hypothetical protein
VKQQELLGLLSEFAAGRLALLQRHEAAARSVAHYDFNNTYQYVVAREETHLDWLRKALEEVGAPLPGPGPALPALPAPEALKGGKTAVKGAYGSILQDDARFVAAFVEQWLPRVEAMTHARHAKMLGVVLGESREHQRLFSQAAAGNEDVLGRRTTESPRAGGVLPTRWVE